MFLLIKFIIGVLLILAIVGVARTWQEEHRANQKLFSTGTVPAPLPDGFYTGTVPGHTFSWLGKKFNAADAVGINVFTDGEGQAERYPFKTSSAKGIRDRNLEVLAIDYDTSGNPFWLRPILDEIVQVAPNQYLGKLHIRLIPGYPVTVGYFELKK